MGYAADVKALTADIAKLTDQINKMHTALNATGKDAGGIFSSLKGIVGKGGARSVGSTGGNKLDGALASFSELTATPASMNTTGGRGSGGGTGGGTMSNGGGAHFMGMNSASFAAQGAVAVGSGVWQATKAAVGTFYNAAPDVSGVVNRAGAYYQAALRSPGMGRAGLEQATFSALRGGITSIGSDAKVANILANAGYAPGSSDYLAAARQTRGAATYLGMQNENAASAIAGLQGGAMGANLYQYGITTMNANGTAKSVGSIAQQLYNTMFPGGATAKSVQASIRSGYAGLNLAGMGMNADQQQMISQALVDIAAGKNPDLASAKSAGGNQNPFDPLFRMNTSSTMIQGAAEKNTISGLGAAAGTIETFNNSMKDVIASMALFKGYLDGLSGNPQGSALKKGASGLWSAGKKILGGVMMLGGVATADPLLAAGGAALTFGGGGTPGFGSSFGGRNMGAGKGAGGLITAGYGARDAQGGNWDSTGGVHQGTDFDVPTGTRVIAVKDGVVSGTTLSADYGQAVVVDHEGGYSTVYAHLSSKEVSPGTRVLQGQEIGKSGKSGNATGPHLHYEVWHGNNNPVNPDELTGASMPVMGANSASMSLTAGSVLAGVVTGGTAAGDAGTTSGGGSSAVNPNAGTSGDQEFAKALLAKAGIGATKDNITALTTWMHWEGGTKNNAFNPLNTTLDMPGATNFNSIGVKSYTSLQQGVDATYQTLTGKNAAGRGYSQILDDLRNNAPLGTVTSHINSSSWGTHIGGGTPGSPGIPELSAGPSASSSVSVVAPSGSDSRVVNFNVYLHDVSDAQAMIWAKKVEEYLISKNEISAMGGR